MTNLTSVVCRHEHFRTEWHARWTRIIGHEGAKHRKVWEFTAISEALLERDMLRPGRRGLGFAVGREPLSSLFASFGCTIKATDLTTGEVAATWGTNGQNANSLDAIHFPSIVPRDQFDKLVSFESVDMNDLSTLERGGFDFLWSACALEHLGGLERGMTFARDAMDLLKPGGIAVHTTEFNVASLTDTITEGGSVIYRQSDLLKLDGDLRRKRCCLEPFDFYPGHEPEDVLFDTEPFGLTDVHIKLELGGHICTSMLLIAHKY